MNRDPSWPTMLANFIEARRHRPFSWGENDCCLFASDWIMVCTGHDPAEQIRGTYRTALGASRIMRARGGVAGIVASVGEPMGLTRIAPAKAQRGDVVLQDNGLGEGLGIVVGAVAAFVAKDGLTFAPYSNASCWRV